ncbi:MAG: mandelate racemase/muconate lactonizing enzyme family protein [Dehalococcoidia bacterium]
MKIKSIEWQGVRVPFREPFITSAGTFRARHSLLIWLHTDTGVIGVGEAPSSLGQGEAGLTRLADTLQGLSASLLGLAVEKVPGRARKQLADRPENSALRFALETASYDALGRLKEIPVSGLLGGQPRPVPVNAIIGATSPQQTSKIARQAAAEGFTTLKLKVGGRPIHDDEAMLEAVRAAVGKEVKLRLDANQAWDVEESIANIRRLAAFDSEYIEEPLKAGALSGLAEVRRSSSIPIAADESLASRDDALRIIEADAADVLVLKTARVGGLEEVRAITELAEGRKLRSVVTSSLETGVGLAASLHLAAATLEASEVCGLATGALLEHDLLTTPLLPRRGLLHTPSLPGLGITIDEDARNRYRVAIEGRLVG